MRTEKQEKDILFTLYLNGFLRNRSFSGEEFHDIIQIIRDIECTQGTAENEKGKAAEKSRQYSEVNKNRRHPTSKSEKEVNKNATIQA